MNVKKEWKLYESDNKPRGVLEKEDDVIDIQKNIDSMHNSTKTIEWDLVLMVWMG